MVPRGLPRLVYLLTLHNLHTLQSPHHYSVYWHKTASSLRVPGSMALGQKGQASAGPIRERGGLDQSERGMGSLNRQPIRFDATRLNRLHPRFLIFLLLFLILFSRSS